MAAVRPQQPECAGGLAAPKPRRKTEAAPLASELKRLTVALATAHAEQLRLDAEFDRALGEGRR